MNEPKEKKEKKPNTRFDEDFLSKEQIALSEFIPGVQPNTSLFSTVTVYGKRKTGKSVFCKWFIQAFRHEIAWAWVFTLTKFNSFYATLFPNKYIMSSFSADTLKAIMDRQRQAIKLHRKQIKQKHPCPINPRALIIWDDYMGNDIRFNKMLHRYYYTGRHFHTMNLFMTQYITETPPPIRTNTDIAILFNTDHRGSLERYAEDFAGKMDKREFIQLFHEATSKPHHFLAVENDPNCPYEKKFFVGNAEMLDAKIDYIFGPEDYWFDSKDQLKDIMDGTMQETLDLTHKMAEHKPDQKQYHKNHGITNVTQVQYKEKSKMKMHHVPEIENKGDGEEDK